MDKETKNQVASYLSDIARSQYKQGSSEYAQAIASFSKRILPLFTERKNSNEFNTALRNLREQAKNSK